MKLKIITTLALAGSAMALQAASLNVPLTPAYGGVDGQNDPNWTVETSTAGGEFALRARIRYENPSATVGVFDGANTYTFDRDADYSGDYAATPNNRSMWNFDISIDLSTVTYHPGGANSPLIPIMLSDVTYDMKIYRDNILIADVGDFVNITGSSNFFGTNYFDHNLSNDGGASFVQLGSGDYANEYGNYDILQQSWNLGFFTDDNGLFADGSSDPKADGLYEIRVDLHHELTGKFGESSIFINQVPEPTSGLLALVGVSGLLLRRRRA